MAGVVGFTINYLKQAIDISYSMQMAQDVRLLKICNFCEKAFIANNPKAEYDTPQCKNKANVYKSRGKNISRNVGGCANRAWTSRSCVPISQIL